MLSIFDRIKMIFKNRENVSLSSLESPSKTAKYITAGVADKVDSLCDNLATIVATRKSIERELDSIKKDISGVESFAMRAGKAGNEADVTVFVTKKASLMKDKEEIEERLEKIREEENIATGAYQTMAKNYKQLELRRKSVESREAIACAKNTYRLAASPVVTKRNAIGNMNRVENKANFAYEKEVAAETAEKIAANPTALLEEKYDTTNFEIANEVSRIMTMSASN